MPHYRSLKDIQAHLASGTITVTQLVQGYLHSIDRQRHLNAFLEVFGDEALAKASELDQKRRDGRAGALAGMVLAIKDNICYQGHQVTASSKILKGFTSLYTATALQRLLDQDAIVIGRTNCDEFAMGASTENSAFGPTLNAADPTRVPGGSSGGSAVAVQAHMCLAALGSDTGGSIRQPAAFTGTVGLRPTYGHVSRYGLLAYASSFDQIGTITQCPEDAMLIMATMAGHDPMDATSATHQAPYNQAFDSNKKLKIGLLRECVEHPNLHPEVRGRLLALAAKLGEMGHEVQHVSFPYTDYVVPNYYVLTTAEASSNLSRFAGMIYGYRSPHATDFASTISKSRSEGFGPEVQRRIMLGTFVLSAGYYDAYYARAQKTRRLVKDCTDQMLEQFDFLLLPTAPHPAFALGANPEPIAMYLEDIFCMQASLAGVPAISVPVQPSLSGLPIGAQLIGPAFSEPRLLHFAGQVAQLGKNLS